MNEERDHQIKKYRLADKWTYEKIGKKFGLSGERIREIVNGDSDGYCAIHVNTRLRSNKCYKCKIKYYFEKDAKQNILGTANRLSYPDRRKGLVYERGLFIDYLLSLNYTKKEIAKLLKRDLTTIDHYINRKSGIQI